MKIKVLSRRPSDYIRETKHDIHKMPRSLNPLSQPFRGERMHQAAINAAKLSNLHAKPFLGVLDCGQGHVTKLKTTLHNQNVAFFGTNEGTLQLWNIPTQSMVQSVKAHDFEIKGICFPPAISVVITVDQECIRSWKVESLSSLSDWSEPLVSQPVVSSGATFLDHHIGQNQFIMGSHEGLALYCSASFESPIRVWRRNILNLVTGAFSLSDENLALVSSAYKNTLMLFDVRASEPVRRLMNEARSNAISWNPQQPYHFVSASEDYNCYTYDIRQWSKPLQVYMAHSNAVLDVHFSPTGDEFVSGSYDNTIKIWPATTKEIQPRVTYHAPRMRKVFQVSFCGDRRYLLSASDDKNVRLWKSKANESLGYHVRRQVASLERNEKLVETFRHHPEVKDILHSRKLPKPLYAKEKELRAMRSNVRRKELNRIKSSKNKDRKLKSYRVEKAGKDLK